MSALDKLVKSRKKSKWIYPSRLIIVLLIGVFVWAQMSELDEVAIAPGKVVPEGRVKAVQHLEGGVIKTLHIREGANVQQNDPLIELTLGVGRLNRGELQAERDGKRLVEARLLAESENTQSLSFAPDLATAYPDIARREQTAFEARRQELRGQISVIQKQIKQKQLSIESLRTQRRAAQNRLALSRENQSLAENAMNLGMGTRSDFLELSAEVEELLGKIRTLDAEIPLVRADVEEARARLSETRLKYQRRASDQLSDVAREISQINEVLNAADEQEARTIIRAPTDGIVKNLKYRNVGAVIGAGEAIMEIVPLRDSLVIEAKLNPVDRGYVQVGLPANIKVTAYDFIRYGTLPGRVTQIAPDTDRTEDGLPYYRVVVSTERTTLGDGVNVILPITTGMETQVDIVTGHRSILDFFLRPVLRLGDEAFRER